jgi:hypothetical protein
MTTIAEGRNAISRRDKPCGRRTIADTADADAATSKIRHDAPNE